MAVKLYGIQWKGDSKKEREKGGEDRVGQRKESEGRAVLGGGGAEMADWGVGEDIEGGRGERTTHQHRSTVLIIYFGD